MFLQVHIDRLLKGMAKARYFNCAETQKGEIFMQERNSKERDCMSLEGFCACVRIDLQRRLGDSFRVMVKDITKNNDTKYKTLAVAGQDTNLHLSIYMDGFYDRYAAGTPLAEVEESIFYVWKENRTGEKFDSARFTEWKNVKERIIYKLVSLSRNRELLKDIPHRSLPHLDLAIVYECFMGAGREGNCVILIYENQLKLWGVTADELYETAVRNTPELMGYRFSSMSEVLWELMGNGEDALEQEDLQELDGECPMYILTNRYKFHGAGCILYKNLLMEIAEKWDDDICILPSSIHETMLVPAAAAGSGEKISEMVRVVNQTQLSPEEVLSDHAYKFVRKTGEIIMQEEKDYE